MTTVWLCVSGHCLDENCLRMVFDRYIFFLRFAAVKNLNKTLNLFKHSYIIHKNGKQNVDILSLSRVYVVDIKFCKPKDINFNYFVCSWSLSF